MDIQQSSDQQSAREITNNSIDTAYLTLSAIEEFLHKLVQLGMKDDQEITIRVSSRKIYDGTVSGEGKQVKLTPKETKTLNEAFAPQENSGSVRILDKNNQLLFKSKDGIISTNQLSTTQTETPTEKTAPVADSPPPASPEVVDTSAPGVESSPSFVTQKFEVLQEKLNLANDRLNEMQARLDALVQSQTLNPKQVTTLNQPVGDWFNQQRNMVADKLRGLANQFSVTASQKFKQTHNQVKQHVHQTLSHTGQQAATVFMQNFVEPAVKVVVSQMEKIGEVDIAQDGTKTFQTNAISWQVTPDGGVNLTRKADNQKITPTSATSKDMNILQSFVQQTHERYGQTQKLLPQSASVENHPPSYRSQIQKA
ncbi:hypothetical protein [Picosynechococcus sp. NKBG042902]|uniref:hypothetical protein n=1 Tax=Picosynechococcus sp. NKBG042902 TaxID=490193 RepID=UPI0004ABAFF4|nr:hypothetical protein [Picosynechococcus sp. NKBG042902]